MFFRILRYDVNNGLLKEHKKFFVAAILFVLMCLNYYMTRDDPSASAVTNQLTYGGCLAFIFKGIPEYKYQSHQPFIFPALWMLLMVFILYIVLDYPFKDMLGYGKQVLIHSRTRGSWWLAKCIWLVMTVAGYFIMLYLIAFLYCVILGIPISMQIAEPLLRRDVPIEDLVHKLPDRMTVELWVMPFLLISALGLMQMFLSLIIRPILSYCVSITWLLASSYSLQPYLIGNYAIISRSDRIVMKGLNGIQGMVILIVLGLVSTILGALYFNRYDIVPREQDIR